ncbi:MAG TPA: SAM-dependent methyltransferase [Clostridiales bacterium]|nr:SAM-dependent methyltransferase [Clostridiales bacterium]
MREGNRTYTVRLSKRLQAVADFVTPGSRVADVGCDHAYTAIYLAGHGIAPGIVAMDVNQGPIDRAKENIRKYGYSDIIETRRSDGLEKLAAGEADTILIAGMGGALMIQILTNKKEVLQSVKELVLQPQSEIHKVRHMLQEEGFLIVGEDMVKEDGKYYFIMRAVKNNLILDAMQPDAIEPDAIEPDAIEPDAIEPDAIEPDSIKPDIMRLDTTKHNITKYVLTEDVHFYYGRLLLEQKHPLLREFMFWDYGLCEGIMQSLGAEQTENSMARKQEINERMGLLQRGLAFYQD